VLLSKSIPNSNVVFVNEDDEDEDTESIISHNKGQSESEIKNEEITTKKKSQNEQPHKQAPYVRVTKFQSNMIIVSHSQDFHSPGLDFYLNYYDDPKAQIPKMAMSWMATSGLPDWLNKLHKAAKRVPKPIERINITDDYEVVLIKEKKELDAPSLNQELEVQSISSPTEEDQAEKSSHFLMDPNIKEYEADKSNNTLIDSTLKEDEVKNAKVKPTTTEENNSPIIIDTLNKTQIEPSMFIKEEMPAETNSSLNSLNTTEDTVSIPKTNDVQLTSEILVKQIENPTNEAKIKIND
jgi:hypothetical protein